MNKDRVKFSISIIPEIESPEHLGCDQYAVDWIREQQERGNEWAWCCVTVTAELEGFKGEAHLGGCAYEDEAQFKIDGYYEDLCHEALSDLESVIDDTRRRLARIR